MGPHGAHGHALGDQHVLEPLAGVTAQQRDRGRARAEGVRGPRRVEALAARDLDEPVRPMDVASHEALDLEQLVDRRVGREADDHVR